MSRGSHALCWIAAVLVAAAPLPFGSVGTLAEAGVQIGLLAAALAWVLLRRRAGLPPLPWRDPLLLGGAALLLYGLVQIAPMPAGLVDWISPATGALKRAYAPEPPAWTSLSLDPYATFRSCLSVVCWTLAALIVRHNAADLKGRLVVGGGLVAGGLFQAGYGLVEFISGRQHIFGYKKMDFTDVATGTFISRNNFAAYLEMALPMALALGMLALDRSRTRASRRPASLKQRLVALAGRESFRALVLMMGAFLMGTALLMSRSRAGILCAAAALTAGGLVLGLRGRSRRLAVCSVGVAALVVLFASQIDILPVLRRFEMLRNEFGQGYGRVQVWRQAMPMLADFPLFGTGLGTWEEAFSPYRTDGAQVRVDFAHNDYLEFAAEAGLLGWALLACGAALVLRSWTRARGRRDEVALAAGLGLAAVSLHSLVDFHMSIPADALAAATLAGLLLREPGPVGGGIEPVAPGPRRAPAAWTAPACAVVLLAMCVAAASPAAGKARGGPAGRDDPAEPDPDPGAASAASPGQDLCPACRLDPFNATRYVDAAARARRKLLADVEALVRSQAGGEPAELATRRYVAARIDEALELTRRARELAPALPRAHMEAGLLLLGRHALTGLPPAESADFDRSLDAFDKALRLQPWRASVHRRVARMTAPLYGDCEPSQRAFIARTARRAVELDPRAAGDLPVGLAQMGL